jgi:hypothetical protein
MGEEGAHIEKIVSNDSVEGRDACLEFLTAATGGSAVHINSIIDCSSYLMYFTSEQGVVAAAIMRLKKKTRGYILDILLAYSISALDKRLVECLCKFAVTYGFSFIYVSPLTPGLRAACIEHEFENIHGIEGMDEVLEKDLEEV